MIHAKCLFIFYFFCFGAVKLVHHVFCHDSAAQQVVLRRSSAFSHSLFKAAAHVGSVGPVGHLLPVTCKLDTAETPRCEDT